MKIRIHALFQLIWCVYHFMFCAFRNPLLQEIQIRPEAISSVRCCLSRWKRCHQRPLHNRRLPQRLPQLATLRWQQCETGSRETCPTSKCTACTISVVLPSLRHHPSECECGCSQRTQHKRQFEIVTLSWLERGAAQMGHTIIKNQRQGLFLFN